MRDRVHVLVLHKTGSAALDALLRTQRRGAGRHTGWLRVSVVRFERRGCGVKKIIGIGLIVTPIVIMFSISVVEKGWSETLIGLGFALLILGMIGGGMALASGEGKK